MMVETYLRRGQRRLQRWMLDPRVRTAGMVLGCVGSGFFLSAAGLSQYPQPLAMGLISAATGWRAVLMGLGAMVGYPTFWGSRGNQGIVWSAAGGLLALLVGKKEESRDQPLMIPAITAFLTAVSGLAFRQILRDTTPWAIYALRVVLAGFSAMLFAQAAHCRDAVTQWLVSGVAVLALAQVRLGPYLGFGYVAAGVLAIRGAFPAAALGGLGLDLAQITPVPMTAVMCVAFFLRMIPFRKRWQHYAMPAVACVGVMAACGLRDILPLPGLALGGALGALLPPGPELLRRRGQTGAAQVRLELGAAVLTTTRRIIQEMEVPDIDQQALLDKVKKRACSGCPARRNCAQRESLPLTALLDPLEADCQRQGRLVPELVRGQEQLRQLKAERQRRQECRQALIQQYRFLSDYLRQLADQLPRRGEQPTAQFRAEAAARSRGKEPANGDKCLAFAGTQCRYYVLLCDGMGTGLGAAQEGQTAANLLRQLLTAGFPAEHSLETVNSLLVLRGSAGAVTVDLAEVALDTGIAHIYKWGAAPSWVLTRTGAEKIGTATPPPGISLNRNPMAVEKLSLRRGEALILLSDGVEGEEALRLSSLSPDLPPGELAEKILEMGRGSGEDDATAAVIRLRPSGLSTS